MHAWSSQHPSAVGGLRQEQSPRRDDVDTHAMEERQIMMWLLYGRIVDTQCPDADEREVIDTLHSVLDQRSPRAGTDPRLIAAAHTAVARFTLTRS